MNTTATGRIAEDLAAAYIEHAGYEVIARNWRTRFCELDIIARRNGILHIIEVKYRASTRYGGAAEYISYDKAQRLQRAALAWRQQQHHTGPYQIDVITVEGDLTQPRIELLAAAVNDF